LWAEGKRFSKRLSGTKTVAVVNSDSSVTQGLKNE